MLDVRSRILFLWEIDCIVELRQNSTRTIRGVIAIPRHQDVSLLTDNGVVTVVVNRQMYDQLSLARNGQDSAC